MDIKGKIILALPEETVTSKSSGKSWKKREYVLETHDQYPRKVHFDLFGERADQYPLSVGEEVTLYFDIESREYNNRWYTSIRGWKVEKEGAQQAISSNMPTPNDFPPQVNITSPNPNEDLPF